MKLIVGLGNPGKEYKGTRHNAGFDAVEALAHAEGLGWREGHKGEMAKGKLAGQDVVLLKPTTFMNLSGESVAETLHFFKLDAKADLWVIHDELDLPVGAMKISIGAGPGGHNGVKSIIEKIGHKDFARFRIGIGKPTDQTPIEDYVLRKPSKEEHEALHEAHKRATEAVLEALKSDLTTAMNKYNG